MCAAGLQTRLTEIVTANVPKNRSWKTSTLVEYCYDDAKQKAHSLWRLWRPIQDMSSHLEFQNASILSRRKVRLDRRAYNEQNLATLQPSEDWNMYRRLCEKKESRHFKCPNAGIEKEKLNWLAEKLVHGVSDKPNRLHLLTVQQLQLRFP